MSDEAVFTDGHALTHKGPHVLGLRSYLLVFGALLGLTGLTVAVSYFEFGPWNIVIALAVASLKASLVAAVFMHLAWEKRFNAVVFLASLVFLAIMLSFTFLDTSTRGIGEAIEGERPLSWTTPFVDGKPLTRPVTERTDAPAEAAAPR